MRRTSKLLLLVSFFALVLMPVLASAGPRSGGSFSGRGGFRIGGGSSMPRHAPSPSYPGGGGTYIVAPGFGWGWGGYGMGGGFGWLGGAIMLAVVGLGVYSVVRAVRRHRQASHGDWQWGGSGYGEDAVLDRAYIYKVQLGLGRSARGIQERLAEFAQGDTGSQTGLAQILQQTSLELLRHKDSIRYAGAEAAGPMPFAQAESKLNGMALSERSRFQLERIRGAEGAIRRSTDEAKEGAEALELVLVTMMVATRAPLSSASRITTHEDAASVLSELGGIAPDALLGLEVVWTPADPNDSFTETDLMTSYPELRSL